jgi:hypothetical protein
LSGPSQPAQIGRYEIRGELGRGMMGVVYEAYDPALGRTIALKTIRLALAPTDKEREDFERRFLTEAQIAARLAHPGIVVVHDVGRDAQHGILYIALEHLQGRTLADVAAEGPMPWRDALRLVGRVAVALRYAHGKGVVHRDIKPANIMVLPSGEPKIMDFGIAKLEATNLTSPGQFFGTPLYMSPEQALGHAVDARTDLFSLGSVAYLLIAGNPPFEAPNVPSILARVAYQHARSLAGDGVPDDAEYVISRAMAKEPGDRYADGQAMAEDIEDVLAGRPPRHRKGWIAPETGASTMVASALPPLIAPAMRAGTVPRAAVPRTQRRRVWRTRLTLVALLGATTAGYFYVRPGDARFWHRIVDAVKRAAVVPEAEAGREAAPVEEPATEGRPASLEAPAAAPAPGRLAIDFEHHLRHGRLQVWVDDAPVYDAPFDAQETRRLLAFTLNRGVVQEVLTLPAGRHEVRVQVKWEDNVASGRIAGTFAAGATRRLDVGVGRIGGKLSLDWK